MSALNANQPLGGHAGEGLKQPDGGAQNTRWSEGQVFALIEMAKAGKSGSEIAGAVGKSRSAVLGRAMRMNIKLGGAEHANNCAKPPAKPKLKMPRSRTFVVGKGPDKAEEKPDKRHTGDAWDPEKAHEGARRVDLMGLERGMCKWPLFSDDEKRIFCGADAPLVADGTRHKPYCKFHGKRARGRVAESAQ